MYLVTPKEMSEMDRRTIEEFGIPGHTLMENAARGAVEVFVRNFPDFAEKKISVICGKGNNGGDGLVMARYLACHIQKMGSSFRNEKNRPPNVYLLGRKDSISGDAALNLSLLEKSGVKIQEIADENTLSDSMPEIKDTEIFIDAIFGTGLNSPVRGIPEKIIEIINSSTAHVFAVDMPSGLDSDNAVPLGNAVKANVTATFGFPKIGHAIFPGASFCGSTEIIDIGIPPDIAESVSPSHRLVTRDHIFSLFSRKTPETHKGSNGHVLVIGGSPGKTGAPSMSSISALKTGAGLVTLAVPKSIRSFAEMAALEIMTEELPESEDGCIKNADQIIIQKITQGKKVIAVGPGMDKGHETDLFLFNLLEECKIPLVIDAGALNILAENLGILKNLKCPAILTPHPGEMSRLVNKSTSEIQMNRIEVASSFAKEFGVILVLKGAGTVIASPEGLTAINRTGNPGLATAGTGDVLTGIISGLLSQGFKPFDAACAGVYIHGAAGDRLEEKIGPSGFTATDVISEIPGVITGLINGKKNTDFSFTRKLESLYRF